MTGDLVKATSSSPMPKPAFRHGQGGIGKCPPLRFSGLCRKGNFYCSNKECSFCLWEDNKFFSSKKKKLTKKIAKELLDKAGAA